MAKSEFRDLLSRAVQLEHPAPPRPAGGGEDAAVLVPWSKGLRGPRVLLTRRTDQVETHKGQIAFPGGMVDPEDQGSFDTAALREAREEMGIEAAQVEVLGRLPPVWTLSRILIQPVVGWLGNGFNPRQLKPNPHEIAEWFWADLKTLRNPALHRVEPREYGGKQYDIHFYQVGRHEVWGATAAVLKNLLDRLEHVGYE